MSLTAGRVIAQKYRLEYVIGEGSQAEVWHASVVGQNESVVLKVVHPDQENNASLFDKLLQQEARLSAMLDHPNIVTTYGLGQEEGLFFIVMERLYGEPLNLLHRLSLEHRGRVLPWEVTASIAMYVKP